jgi:hypothetical protein
LLSGKKPPAEEAPSGRWRRNTTMEIAAATSGHIPRSNRESTMTANQKKTTIAKKTKSVRTPGQTRLLALTLVPIIAGGLLVIAWAVDWELVPPLENQAFLGLLFILLGFTLSNLIQKKWTLAAGWGLLTLADLLLLTQRVIWIQIGALALTVAGLLLLAVEFYRQYQQNRSG